MRLNNGKRIITEDDIILSDSSTLSEKFASQQKDIDELKSNVKWMYKYGGVGSGTGSSSSTQDFSIYATLNNIQINDNTIVLNSTGTYTLYISINNPNNMDYNVQYTYSTTNTSGNTVTQSYTQILSIENNYTFSTNITLNNNATLTVQASNGNSTQSVTCSYVTTPYSFSTSLVNDSGTTLSSEIFTSTAASAGVNIKLTYSISITASVTYTYTFNNETYTGTITDSSGNILFAIPSELFTEANSGYYSATINLEVIPENQSAIDLEYVTNFTLVPDSLYCLVQPESGTIYVQPQNDSYYEYSAGYITFNYRIYQGVNQNRTYSITITLNGESSPIVSSTVTERQQNSFKIFSVTSGINYIDIVVTGTSIYTARYYFYVAETDISLDWFDYPEDWTKYYYRIDDCTDNFSSYLNQTYIAQTSTSNTISITDIETPNLTGDAILNTHIAIGIQYNAINSDDATIVSFYNTNSSSSAVLTINAESVIRNSVEKELYLYKQSDADGDTIENYHLIQIYSQYVKSIGNENYYELSLYIDGVLEQVFPSLTNSPLLITNFTIEKVNCYINLLEIDFKEGVTNGEANSNCDYEVYKYFIKYKNYILREDVENELLISNYVENFEVGLDGRVTTDIDTINNIATYSTVPTLILTYQDSGTFSDFMGSLETDYGEDGTGTGSDMNFPVTLQWSPGGTGTSSVESSMPNNFSNAQFRVSLQGSSTKTYRVKNFTLSLENTDDSETAQIYLFSPNYADGDSSTFLPETEFILKADVVDSSHSNNTTCGKFINTVCNKFSNNISDNSIHKDYIRNCLEGFPIMLYLSVVTTDSTTGTTNYTYYYLGIYNFNLGRTSYYNLGYKDLTIFENNGTNQLNDAGDSFTFYAIESSDNALRSGLGIAEIQGGSNYFDFSQYDSSILFQQTLSGGYTDNTYMFGDLVYGSNSTELQLQSEIQTFVQKVALAGGYLFEFLNKNFGDYSDGYNAEVYDGSNATGESLNQVPNYKNQYQRQLTSTGAWEYVLKETISSGEVTDLTDLIIPNTDTGRLAALDYQSASEYYTICMVLGLVDSVCKNLNIKTWNGTTWYIAFYDMDTCLGINNQGNDITYFAFSDYWSSNTETINDVDYPSQVSIYRDFSPSSLGENGFDIPSSYLFAVVKYARLIDRISSDEASAYTSVYPQELYAKWRSSTINTDTNQGVLCNADTFIGNYFSNNLKSVCPIMVSYNYRSKYLSLGSSSSSTSWVSTDYNKFNGTRINKVIEWLKGRLHILDAYFNLNQNIINNIQYRDADGNWQPLTSGGSYVTDLTYTTNYSLSSNSDIVILHDIFGETTNSAGIQIATSPTIMIKCPEYSPLQIYNSNATTMINYILGGDNYQSISFTTTGTQNIKIGGSQAWTYLENIDWISMSSSLTINSDNLENITGSSGSFSGLTLNTPAVQDIELTSSSYQGTLTLSGSNNYPNLRSVNISRSNISLTLSNLNVDTVNISNVGSASSSVSISITDCTNIDTFTYSNCRLSSLSINGIQGTLKNLTIANTNISSMTFTCYEEGGTLIVHDDNTLENLTFGGFENVEIYNCSNLVNVTINNTTYGSNLKSIQLYNCTATNLQVTTSGTTSDAGVADFSGLTESLDTCYLYNSTGIQHVILPDGSNLVTNCFYALTNLQSVGGNNLKITGSGCFRNCYLYSMRDRNGDYTDFTVDESTTSLSYMFCMSNDYSNISIADVRHFFDNCVPENNSVAYTQYMFQCQAGIEYGLDDMIEDIANQDVEDYEHHYISLIKLSKVTNATNMFNRCKITAFYKEMWNFGASQVNTTGFCSYPNNTVYVTIDSLSNIITKATSLFQDNNTSDNCGNLCFVDDSGSIINGTVSLKDFFNPTVNDVQYSPYNLVTLGLSIVNNTNQVIDFKDMFNSSWSSLTTLRNFCMSQCACINLDNLLYNLPNLKTLYNVFRYTSSASNYEPFDWFTFINWNSFLTNNSSTCGSITINNTYYTAGMLGIERYINADDYITLTDMLLNSAITDISYLFRNTTIIGWNNYFSTDWTFGSATNAKDMNSTISKLRGTFWDCSMKQTLDSSSTYPMPLSSVFFNSLSGIEDVQNLFRGCYFSNPIPFNLFNKRTIDPSVATTVYVRPNPDEETYIEATRTQYTYNTDIYRFENLFYNASFSSGARHYDPSLYNIPENSIIGSDGNPYTTYYVRTTVVSGYDESGVPQYTYNYTRYELEQNTEITDAENLTGGYAQTINLGSSNYTNFSLDSGMSSNNLMFPPDLFYGATTNVTVDGNEGVMSYDYALAVSSTSALCGIIPKNTFKNNRSGTISNTFYNQYVIPSLVTSWGTSEDITNVYSCFPSDFISTYDLNYAFNAIPSVISSSSSSNQTITNWCTILLQDSIPSQTSSLQYAFNYNTVNTTYQGQNNTEDASVYFTMIGNVNGESFTPGFNMNNFTNLNIDYLFYTPALEIMRDTLFYPTYDLANASFSSSTSYVFKTKTIYYGYISSLVEFPRLTKSLGGRLLQDRIYLVSTQVNSQDITYYQGEGVNFTDLET